MLYSYIAFIGCAVTKDRRRKYAMAAVLSAMMLAVSVWLGDTGRYGVMNALALDVGQGESVALWSGKEAALVDCGSSNSYVDAGGVAADQLGQSGRAQAAGAWW